MHAKNNRQNKDFQIIHFLVGSCHTPDAAYSLLCDLRDDRDTALRNVQASDLRNQAKAIRAKRMIASEDEATQLEGQADLAEIEAFSELGQKNIAAAKAELAFIDKCITTIQPLRKYKHLPDPEAHEACQQEEWKLELIQRAENHMLLTGTIPPGEFETMRMHPEFESAIIPVIQQIKKLALSPGGADQLLLGCAKKEFDLPLLLENIK